MASPATNAIRTYLGIVGQPKKRGRRRAGAVTVRAKLREVTEALADARSLERVLLFQEKLDLEERLRELDDPATDPSRAEDEFVEHIAAWAAAKHVSYSALLKAGVPSAVLRRGGMTP